jgi:hypothetical protein
MSITLIHTKRRTEMTMTDFNRPTDREIIEELSRALSKYFENLPEVAKIKIVCEREDDSLVRSLHFYRRP